MFYSIIKTRVSFFLLLFIVGTNVVSAQTTEFTYQGKIINTAGTAASYDFEFRLPKKTGYRLRWKSQKASAAIRRSK